MRYVACGLLVAATVYMFFSKGPTTADPGPPSSRVPLSVHIAPSKQTQYQIGIKICSFQREIYHLTAEQMTFYDYLGLPSTLESTRCNTASSRGEECSIMPLFDQVLKKKHLKDLDIIERCASQIDQPNGLEDGHNEGGDPKWECHQNGVTLAQRRVNFSKDLLRHLGHPPWQAQYNEFVKRFFVGLERARDEMTKAIERGADAETAKADYKLREEAIDEELRANCMWS